MKRILIYFKSLPFRWRRIYRQRKCLSVVKSHEGEIFVAGTGRGTTLTSNTILHKNPNFNGLTIKGGGRVEIGDNFHSGEDCLIITQNHNYDSGDALPYDNTFIYKDVKIEDNVWFGDRVIVLGGCTIGEGAILQAGCLVTKDVPPLSIVGGIPAKVFKMRDQEHYNKLKALGKFH